MTSLITAKKLTVRDCSLFIVQGEAEEKLYSYNIFSLPPVKTSKIFKAPPPNRQNKNINFGPPSSSLSLFRETKIDNEDQYTITIID
jgi:hypothetical protein